MRTTAQKMVALLPLRLSEKGPRLMFRKLTLAAVLAVSATSAAAEAEAHIENFDFSFEGPFGSFDQNQLQLFAF